jgi:hypothetical protein
MITEKELFDRLVTLETDKLTAAEDIKQLKSDATYNEDDNPQGISKDDIKLVAKAAVLEARNKYEEQKEAVNAVFKKYEELTNYNC